MASATIVPSSVTPVSSMSAPEAILASFSDEHRALMATDFWLALRLIPVPMMNDLQRMFSVRGLHQVIIEREREGVIQFLANLSPFLVRTLSILYQPSKFLY
jgi:hypothetical protein